MDETPDNEKLPTANLPSVTKKIGGHSYVVWRLDWWGVNDVVERLAEILGPSLEGLADGVPLRRILDVDSSDILPLLIKALGRATGERGRELQEILGKQTVVTVDDRQVNLDRSKMGIWFSQQPKEALPWLGFALEVQVRDFFEPLIGAAPSPRASRKNARTTRAAAGKAKGQKSPSI